MDDRSTILNAIADEAPAEKAVLAQAVVREIFRFTDALERVATSVERVEKLYNDALK